MLESYRFKKLRKILGGSFKDSLKPIDCSIFLFLNPTAAVQWMFIKWSVSFIANETYKAYQLEKKNTNKRKDQQHKKKQNTTNTTSDKKNKKQVETLDKDSDEIIDDSDEENEQEVLSNSDEENENEVLNNSDEENENEVLSNSDKKIRHPILGSTVGKGIEEETSVLDDEIDQETSNITQNKAPGEAKPSISNLEDAKKTPDNKRKKSLRKELWKAVAADDSDMVNTLLDQGVSESRDKKGNTALHYAAKKGKTNVIEPLLNYIDTKNRQNKTPLQVAVDYNQRDMINGLIEVMTETNCLLEYLIKLGKIDDLKYYLEESPHKKKLRDSTQLIRSLVSHTIRYGCHDDIGIQKKILNYLIKLDPTCRSEPYDGQPLFHEVIDSGREYLLKILYENFVDLALENKSGLTAVEHLKNSHEIKDKTRLNSRLKRIIDLSNRREELLNKNINSLITDLEKALKFKDHWTLLKKQDGKCRLSWDSIIKNSLKQNLTIQTRLSARDPDYKDLLNLLIKKMDENSNSLTQGWLSRTLNEEQLSAQLPTWLPKLPDEDPKKQISEEKKSKLKEKRYKHNSPPEIRTNSFWQSLMDYYPMLDCYQPLTEKQEEFFNVFEKEFDKAYSEFFSKINPDFRYKKDDFDECADLTKKVAPLLPNFSLPIIPGVSIAIPTSLVVTAAVDLTIYYRDQYRRQKAQRMIHLFEGCGPLERALVIRSVAIFIAMKYRKQLAYLASGSDGVSKFATCVTWRIIDYIISSDEHHDISNSKEGTFRGCFRALETFITGKQIPTQLTQKKKIFEICLDGLLRVTNFPKDMDRLRTIGNTTLWRNWSSKALIENTGVMTPDKTFYSHENCDKKYGYTLGTEVEAHGRKLTETDSSNQPWPKVEITESSYIPSQNTPIQKRYKGTIFGDGNKAHVKTELQGEISDEYNHKTQDFAVTS